mgnify:CR=1 FL=1
MARRHSLKMPDKQPGIRRRGLLKGAVGAGVCGVAAGVGLGSFSSVGYAAAMTKEQRDAMTPDEIVAMIKQGNERFRSGNMQQHDYLAQKRASAMGQYPAAAILSCIDSRTPAELLLDMGLGEAFNARVAGNICNDDVLGSLEFACAVAGAKVILVMGHTACGAIKGAIDNGQLGNLTGLLDTIKPAIEATRYEGERSSSNPEFVDMVAVNNVRLALDEIRDESSVLADLASSGDIKLVGAMYHLNGGQLEILS